MSALLLVAALTFLPGTPLERCDGELEVCRTDPGAPWPDADLPALCRAKPVFCDERYIDARPAEVAGFREGDPVGNRGEVTGEALWAVWDNWDTRQERRRAVLVMACESGFDPDAGNPRSSAAGLWQWLRRDWRWYTGDVMGEVLPLSARFDPGVSSRVTAHRVDRYGWSGWSCKGWTP